MLEKREILQCFARIVDRGVLLDGFGGKECKQRKCGSDTVRVVMVFDQDEPSRLFGFQQPVGYGLQRREKRLHVFIMGDKRGSGLHEKHFVKTDRNEVKRLPTGIPRPSGKLILKIAHINRIARV